MQILRAFPYLAPLAACVALVAAGRADAPTPPVVHTGPSPPAVAWRKAMEAGDLAALARMHDAATIAYPPGRTVVTGADAIMKDYAGTFAAYSVKVVFDDAHWVEVPPLVVSWGRTTLTFHPKPGGPKNGAPDIVAHTRFTDAAARTDGGWRYLVDHASVRSPK